VYRGLVKLRALSFIGQGFSDNSDFIISPGVAGASREQVLTALFDHMFKNGSRWDEILLAQLADTSPNFDLVKKETERNGYDVAVETLIVCPYIEIAGDFETYYQGLGKNLKHDVAKKSRRLAEQGLEPSFEVVTRIDDRVLAELRELNQKRFEAAGHRSFFLREDRFSFLRELASIFTEKQRWLLFLFRVKGKLVAYRLCFAYNGTVYDWNTSYDVEYSQYSLGKILLKPVLEYCFEQGYKVFDFMAGDEDYKLKWTGKTRTNWQIAVRHRNLKTGLMKTYSSIKRRAQRVKKR
jgi:CelD/BcsL family acetyltransferase involved in cellulose biosynthesis